MTLTPKIRQQLKAKAHKLKPFVMIGGKGLTKAVLKEIDQALNDHELIKVRISVLDKEEKQNMIQEICSLLNAERVQLIGKICVLYRKNES